MKKVLAFLILVIIVFTAWLIFKHKGAPFSGTGQPAQASVVAAINGMLVPPQIAHKRPIAVMIENYPDARPQSGLSDADIVYETLAEGGITRFEAVYQTKEAKNIGPVRSAREYYADIAEELKAAYAHVGGSDMVLEKIKENAYPDISNIDQYFNDTYFERIKTRFAPHNVYTSTNKLMQWLIDKKATTSASYTDWQFKDDAPTTGPAITDIDIDFSLNDYKVAYEYNASKNDYKRLLAGKPHVDADTQTQIQPKTVIIQFVETSDIPNDPKLRITIHTEGSGKALIFQDGKMISGSWKKNGNERTLFTDESGMPISLNRGQAWVELVPNDNNDGRVTWSTQTGR